MNTFQILAKKRLISLTHSKIISDEEFMKELAKLLYKFGTPKEELLDIFKDIRELDNHNLIQEKNEDYVEDRFKLFDLNLNYVSISRT